MRILTMGLASASLLIMSSCATVPEDAPVQTTAGQVAGLQTQTGAEAFLGIPYAAPPVGELRWRAPEPIEPWEGIFQATEYGSDCAQLPFPSDAAPLGTEPDEDCLFMNVWRPAGAKAGDDLPVLVWIHGGGFVNGGASPETYSGQYLAEQGIVFASFNYRLGRFGSFVHPAIQQDASDVEKGGNFGLLDQVAALEWVRDNIASFGGNPDQVTLIGESAGGMSVHAMLTSPLAQGLIHGAVIQSGANGDITSETSESATDAALRFARSKGIEGRGPDAAEALRNLSEDDVVDGLNLATLFMAMMGPSAAEARTFSSMIADDTVAVNMIERYESGDFPKIPVMLGPTSNDIGGEDGYMIQGALDVAEAMSSAGAPVWHYTFDYVAETLRTPDTAGADHASEIPFFFGTVNEKYEGDTTPLDLRASETVMTYLVNFTKTGNPNGEGLPSWETFSEDRHSITFGPDGGAEPVTK